MFKKIFFIFLCLLFIVSVSSASTPECYKEAEYPAHEYVMDFYYDDFITKESVTFLKKGSDECISSELVLGLMTNLKTLYIPFEYIYAILWEAYKRKDYQMILYLNKKAYPQPMKIQDFLDLAYRDPLGGYDRTRILLETLKQDTWRFRGSWYINIPDEYLKPVLYLALGGEILKEPGEYYLYKPEDIKTASGGNPKGQIEGSSQYESIPASWLLKWAGIETQEESATGAWNSPLIVN